MSKPYQLPDDVRAAIFQALGQASMCWTKVDRAGVFLTEVAADVGADLCLVIEAEVARVLGGRK